MSLMLLGILNQQASGGGGAYDLLETVSLTSVASSVTFSAINQTYKHLQIRVVSRTTFGVTSVTDTVRLNADSGSNYSQHFLYGNGSSVNSLAATSQNYLRGVLSAGSGATANSFGRSVIDILDYNNTSKYKTSRSLMGADDSITLASTAWMSLSAVTSISITAAASANYVAGSRFSLYGIKG